MWKKVLFSILAITFASAILIISVFRSASVKYDFNPLVSGSGSFIPGDDRVLIDYYLPYPGKVLPDSPLWPLKAIRDKLWLLVNTNPSREAELKLLFADKRLGSAALLFQKGKFDDGFSALTKAEKYLEEASVQEEVNRRAGLNTDEFLIKISKASLKHYQITEEVLAFAPDEAKPAIINVQDYPKKVYETSRNALNEEGIHPPKNPFDWQ